MTDPIECQRCGQVHKRCRAHNRKGEPCGNGPLPGARVCGFHGGKSPRALAAAKRRQEEEVARAAVVRFGIPADTDPHTQLTRLINMSAGLVAFYRWQCQRIKPDGLVWGDLEVRHDFRGVSVTQRAEINLWLRLFNEERKELRTLCQVALGAGLAEREVRLAEQHGALINDVLRRVLSDLELNPEQQTRALNVVPLRLREYGLDHASDTTVVSDPGRVG